MAKRSRTVAKIDKLMEQAGEALHRTDYFECERLANEALNLAFGARDWERMARILLPLEESRRQKRLEAADDGRVHVMDDPQALLETEKIEPGCWLLEPMIVGAHGRDFRERADAQGVPTIVIVREPKTQLGRWPIVMIGALVVRTRVDPPEALTPEWFVEAGEALGDEAIDEVDTDLEAETRVSRLLDRLNSLRDHDRLHQALMEACREAVRSSAAA